MTFARGIFLFALVMLLTGIIGSKLILSYLFGGMQAPPAGAIAYVGATNTPTTEKPTAAPTSSPRPATGRATSPATATSTSTSRSSPTARPRAAVRTRARAASTPVRSTPTPIRRTPTATPTPTISPTPLPSPSPTPTTGIVTLARYWVAQPAAAPGQTVAIGYVIDNGTGQTERISLGASIKADRVASWASGEIDDPSHDVVAIVPPGVTTHTRYFTLPSSLHGGTYEVAWGLRDADSGARVALVAAPSALRVER